MRQQLFSEREYTFDQLFLMFLEMLRHVMNNQELIEDPWMFGCMIGSCIEHLSSEQQDMVFEILKIHSTDLSKDLSNDESNDESNYGLNALSLALGLGPYYP